MLNSYFNGQTPLIHACEKANYDIVKLLLDNSALIDFPDKYGQTALTVAIENRKLDVVELLV